MRERPNVLDENSLDTLGDMCRSASDPPYIMLRMLVLLRELCVRVCRLRLELGGSLDRRAAARLGDVINDGSPGTVSSVKPARELGARASVGDVTSLSMLVRL